MALRIPLSNDQTLQTEFHEIERRLRKLETAAAKVGLNSTVILGGTGAGSASLGSVYARLTALEQALAALSTAPIPVESIEDYVAVGPDAAKGAVPDPGIAVPPTGVAQHVLTEDNYWGFPFRGLVQVLSPGDLTDPSDALNVMADLGVNGYLSAYDINCRHLATLDGVTLEGDTYQLSSDERGLVRSVTDGTQTQPPYDVVNILGGLQVGDVTAADVECFNLFINGDLEYRDSFWDDLRIEPVARTTGTGAPAFEKWFDDSGGTSAGVYLYSLTDESVLGNEKSLFFSMQMPHAWKLGTNIHLHVHWVGSVSDTTADPRFGLEYTFKDIGEVYGDTTIVYSNGTHTDGSANDPNVTAGKHYLTELPDIVPGATADGVSAILIGRIFRNSSDAGDTYDAALNKVGILYIDAHYETDSPGSSSEYVK